jgi:hypothetical protein
MHESAQTRQEIQLFLSKWRKTVIVASLCSTIVRFLMQQVIELSTEFFQKHFKLAVVKRRFRPDKINYPYNFLHEYLKSGVRFVIQNTLVYNAVVTY